MKRITSATLGLALAILTLIPALRAPAPAQTAGVQQWPTPACQPIDPNCPIQQTK